MKKPAAEVNTYLDGFFDYTGKTIMTSRKALDDFLEFELGVFNRVRLCGIPFAHRKFIFGSAVTIPVRGNFVLTKDEVTFTQSPFSLISGKTLEMTIYSLHFLTKLVRFLNRSNRYCSAIHGS